MAGRVVDGGTGIGVEGAWVVFGVERLNPGNVGCGPQTFRHDGIPFATTNAQGNYRIEGIVEPAQCLFVYREDYGTQSFPLTSDQEGAKELTADVRLEPRARWTGRILVPAIIDAHDLTPCLKPVVDSAPRVTPALYTATLPRGTRNRFYFGGVLPGIPRRTSKRVPSPTRMRRASTASAMQPSITAPTAASLTSTGPHKQTEAHVKKPPTRRIDDAAPSEPLACHKAERS